VRVVVVLVAAERSDGNTVPTAISLTLSSSSSSSLQPDMEPCARGAVQAKCVSSAFVGLWQFRVRPPISVENAGATGQRRTFVFFHRGLWETKTTPSRNRFGPSAAARTSVLEFYHSSFEWETGLHPVGIECVRPRSR